MKKLLIYLIGLNILFAVGCGKKISEKEYFDRAYQYMGKEQWSEAEKNFEKILEEYPTGEYAAKALFMIGFINANYLMNYEKARKYYNEFLEKYPNDDLADDARYEINNLGKDINELPFFKEEGSEEDSVKKVSQKVVFVCF